MGGSYRPWEPDDYVPTRPDPPDPAYDFNYDPNEDGLSWPRVLAIVAGLVGASELVYLFGRVLRMWEGC